MSQLEGPSTGKIEQPPENARLKKDNRTGKREIRIAPCALGGQETRTTRQTNPPPPALNVAALSNLFVAQSLRRQEETDRFGDLLAQLLPTKHIFGVDLERGYTLILYTSV